MTVTRFFAISFIFAAVSIGWVVLGGSMVARTNSLDASLSKEMESLWGPRHLVQPAPYVSQSKDADRRDGQVVASSTITAAITHQNRYKGLLWYSTFSVKFDGLYKLPARGGAGYFIFNLPDGVRAYDDVRVSVDGEPRPLTGGEIASGHLAIGVAPDASAVSVSYVTAGQDTWIYSPADGARVSVARGDGDGDAPTASGGAMGELKDFSLTITTTFADIDYPRGSRSPSEPAKLAGQSGARAQWQFASAMTNQPMGAVMPRRANAGPIVARMSFFAPVSLLFFFTALFAVVVIKKVPLHPMHYLFISAGFFAFHILLAYLADVVNIHAAFWICAAVSLLLVVSYMRLVAGMKFAVLYAGLAQVVYLVGFSYAFFWVGYTGLAITIVAILTLLVLMQATGRVNWSEVFKKRNGWQSVPPPLPTPLPPQSRPDDAGPVSIC